MSAKSPADMTNDELGERLGQAMRRVTPLPEPDLDLIQRQVMQAIRAGEVQIRPRTTAERVLALLRPDSVPGGLSPLRAVARPVALLVAILAVGYLGLSSAPIAERARSLASATFGLLAGSTPGARVQGGWQTTSPLLAPRASHGIALLDDGRVLVTGGTNVWLHYTAELLHTSEVFDPSTNKWSATGSLNTARFWFGNLLTLPGGKVLIAGGTDNTGYGDFDSCELYDPDTGRWSFTGELGIARRSASLTVLGDGRVLIAGGGHGPPTNDRFLASAEIYDPQTATWSPAGDMATPREGHWAVRLLDGRVMVGGGEQPGGGMATTAEIYDPQTGRWSPAGRMAEGRVTPAAVVLPDGRVLVVGGWNGKVGTELVIYASAEAYDPARGQWSLVTPMNLARNALSAHLLRNGSVAVVGGANKDSEVQAAVETYDPLADKWTLGPPWPDPRRTHVAITLDDGSVLVTGGWIIDPVSGQLVGTVGSDRYYAPRRP